MSKNIVIFSDGTGQEGGEGNNTNVYKLFNMVLDRTDKQIAFYDRGLGTGFRKITGNSAGMGMSKNIQECYQFLFENFEAGDDIFLFGFSRGAATVRSLSGYIHLFGILPKSRPELIKKAYKIYEIKDKNKRTEKASEFIDKHHTMWTGIKFIGVWDTVVALGVPFKPLDDLVDAIPIFSHRFHDFKLSESIRHARHALAIDDERLTFHPTLWDPDIDQSKQTMKQVWFCGMHTDVGGGYKEQQLSDITLDWMVNEAKVKGLLIYDKNKVPINPDPQGHMHNSRGGTFSRFFRKEVRFWPETHGKPTIHKSVLERTKNQKNKDSPPYKPWILDLQYEVEL
jgi:uncharacterized protein (DUF2235 family)